jgi:putative ABC transport system substrate-binding protein
MIANAQQPTEVARIGILSDETQSLAESFEPFARGLRDLGYIERRNIAFERRYAAGNPKILASLAAELVRLQPDVILAIGTPATRAAGAATQTIPIVFARVADPVGLGLVRSLAQPGANLTGLSLETWDLAAKWLGLLITAVPAAKQVGALWDPSFPAAVREVTEITEAARTLNVGLVPAQVRGPDEIEAALSALVRQRADALIVVPGFSLTEHSQRIAELAVKARLPTMFARRRNAGAGGLMSYGPNYSDMYRRAAAYVDKIFKGAKPVDLPVEQPTKFEFVINLKTAKALGLTIPLTLLTRADEVIE